MNEKLKGNDDDLSKKNKDNNIFDGDVEWRIRRHHTWDTISLNIS